MSGRGFHEEREGERGSSACGQTGTLAILPSSNFRTQSRRRTRLQSAKLLDCANTFLVEALIRDRSAGGICLLLARNVGLPMRFGVHDDATGEILTVATAWRRGQTMGVRILGRGAARPLKPSDRIALRGRYYGIRN
jgi:hypothetical protein